MDLFGWDYLRNVTFPFFPNASEFLIGLEVFIAAVGLLGNCLIILVIGRSKILHCLTNYLILNLAISDALVCVCGILNPFLLWSKYTLSRPPFCYTSATTDAYVEIQIYSIIQRGFSDVSPFCLLLLTVERFVGIMYPLDLPNFFSKKRLVVILVLVWVTPFVIEVPAGLWFIIKYIKNNCSPSDASLEPWIVAMPTISSVISVLAPIIAMAVMYTKIMRNLKRNARRLELEGIQGPPQELHRAHQRVVHTLVLITVAFVVFIFPSRAIYIMTVKTASITEPQSVVHQQAVVILIALNSSVNPILYGFKYDKLRKAFTSMILPRSRVEPVQIEVTTVNGTQSTGQ